MHFSRAVLIILATPLGFDQPDTVLHFSALFSYALHCTAAALGLAPSLTYALNALTRRAVDDYFIMGNLRLASAGDFLYASDALSRCSHWEKYFLNPSLESFHALRPTVHCVFKEISNQCH